MSGYESDTCGQSYTIRIRYVWTQIFLYPHKKICGYKISGYVWTGPECCSADFWPVSRIGLSWNFKVLQWINLNESFCEALLYTVWRLCGAILKKFVRIEKIVSEIYKKALKVQVLNEVILRQVVRKRVSFKDTKIENTLKFPNFELWY